LIAAMLKKLIVCADGTWNDEPRTRTNVALENILGKPVAKRAATSFLSTTTSLMTSSIFPVWPRGSKQAPF
jgi:hypothetical protein